MLKALRAIDVFSGGGGLTLGLKRAGFRVVAGIEIDPFAVATYKANHPEVRVIHDDIRRVTGRTLKALARGDTIHLLAGCPPCQGFCSLTAKRRKPDERNELVLEMARVIKEIRPVAFMMENVPRLAATGKGLFDRFLSDVHRLGYLTRWAVLQVADFGVPQSRKRLVVLGGNGFAITLPSPTHSKNGTGGLLRWLSVRDAIHGEPNPKTLAESLASGGPEVHNWRVVRTLSPENFERIRRTKPGMDRSQLPNRLRPMCHHDLDVGFLNVYGRMSWTDVSPTITAGCTSFSKGRFGHPKEHRTISVREAALLQTFPADYSIACPYIDRACSIVGNALPCDFAEVLAKRCAEAIRHSGEVR